MQTSALSVGYLALFALASAGSVVDEVQDRRPLSAMVVLGAHLLGFATVLASVENGLRWWLAPAIPLMLAGGLLGDVWSSLRCARLTAGNAAIALEQRDSELVGIGILLALRVPGYLCGLPLWFAGT